MRKSYLVILCIISLSFIMSIYFYSQLPDEMASHWDFKGEPNDYMPKAWASFLVPLLSFGLFLIFVVIPRVDPLKENIEEFRKYFDGFIILLMLFLLYLHGIMLALNLGISFNIGIAMVPAMAVLYYYMGVLVDNAKRNWFIGIRNPWTISSEHVWKKTHKKGGKLFKIVAVITLLGLLYVDYAIYTTIIPVILAVIYLFVYSYLEYKKEKE